MLRMSYWVATSEFESMSHFPTRSLPSYSLASASTCGAMARHGEHQTAQKSTSTGILEARISVLKFESVTSTMFSLAMRHGLARQRVARPRATTVGTLGGFPPPPATDSAGQSPAPST